MNNKNKSFQQFIDGRLASYGAMAAAVVAGAVSPAQAAMVYFDPADVTTPYNGSVFFNPTNGASVSTSNSSSRLFEIRHFGTGAFSNATYSARALGLKSNAGILSSFGYAARLIQSNSVGAQGGFGSNSLLGFRSVYTTTFYSESTYTTSWRSGNFGYGGAGYIGLKFDIAGQAHFGWAEISVDFYDMTTTLHRFAYNDQAGASAHVGDNIIPEPSSAVLLALGAAGLAAYRRRKQAA